MSRLTLEFMFWSITMQVKIFSRLVGDPKPDHPINRFRLRLYNEYIDRGARDVEAEPMKEELEQDGVLYTPS